MSKSSSPTIVLKFGGSSQCETGLKLILQKSQEYLSEGNSLVFVISALGKTTNNLYNITRGEYGEYDQIYKNHKDLCEIMGINFDLIEDKFTELAQLIDDFKNLNKILSNYVENFDGSTYNLKLSIISFGEILSSMIVYEYLKQHLDVEFYQAVKLIKNKNNSDSIDKKTLNIKGEFYCDLKELNNLNSLLNKTRVVITQGFIANTSDNKICILTRSGSNTSASLIASSLNAKRLEIWTDVSGLYTCDPRIIPNAKVIPRVNYSVCQEAAAMGSQIIHPFSIKPCEEKSIPIHIKNTFKPFDIGTIITPTIDEDNQVHLISTQSDITIFEITSMDMWEAYGFSYDIFKVFNKHKIDVNIISTSQFTISTTTNEKNKDKLMGLLKKLTEKYTVKMISECVVVSVVANDVKHNEKIQNIHKLIGCVEPIYMIHYGSNNLSLSWVINKNYCTELMNILHTNLIE
jgi:aspartate kinase